MGSQHAEIMPRSTRTWRRLGMQCRSDHPEICEGRSAGRRLLARQPVDFSVSFAPIKRFRLSTGMRDNAILLPII
jgi:hypothetical protein